jgi:hypothetical protein
LLAFEYGRRPVVKWVLTNLAQSDLAGQLTMACEGEREQIKDSINGAITK